MNNKKGVTEWWEKELAELLAHMYLVGREGVRYPSKELDKILKLVTQVEDKARDDAIKEAISYYSQIEDQAGTTCTESEGTQGCEEASAAQFMRTTLTEYKKLSTKPKSVGGERGK